MNGCRSLWHWPQWSTIRTGPLRTPPQGARDDRHHGQRGRGPRAAQRPTGTEATSPRDAASNAVGGAAAGGSEAAHRGAEDRAHALRAGLQGFFPDTVQQRRSFPRNAFLSGLWSRSFVFPVKAVKISAQDRVRQRLRLFTLHLVRMMTPMGLAKGFFALFPRGKVRSAGQVSADLPRHISSWTPAAYEQSRGSHEQEVEMEKKAEMEAAEYEEKMQELKRRVQVDLPLSAAERLAWRQWIVAYAASSSSIAGKRRKRKKRSKRKLPKSSSGVRIRRCGQGFRSRSSFSGAQCSLLLTTGPRCSTSWPVRNRRTVMCSSCARLVFLAILHLTLCFLPCLQARDARHHGRYGPTRRTRMQLVGFSLRPLVSGSLMSRQSTAASVGGAFRMQRNAWFDSGFGR